MRKKLLFLSLLFGFGALLAQTKYPTDYFSNPLDIPLILSGNFGELRSNHFHAGLDIKTQQRQGLPVYAPANGSVSRINIQLWGYGKALYITHPNGYTTVYGHLKKFAPKIEAYIKKLQYEKESFTVEAFPKSGELTVEKGELIAYTGNTGGSGGPHLHFEIRDSKSNPINPMLFGIEIPDSRPPEIRSALVYSFGDSSQVNQTNRPFELQLKRQKDGSLLADKIEAFGTIGIGINAIDKQDGALNHNGIYSLEMYVNGERVYEHDLETISFAESSFINTFIDYARYVNKRQYIQKCFVVPANKLSIYHYLKNNGFLTINDGLSYTVRIIVRDVKGNKQELTIPIKGKKEDYIVKQDIPETPYYFKVNEFNKIEDQKVSVAFPKQSFYEDLYFDFSVADSIVHLHDPSVALNKPFTLTFDISDLTAVNKKQLFIASISDRGRLSYNTSTLKENKIYTLSKKLGTYTIAIDSVKPRIIPINFKDNQWLSNYRFLELKVSDNLTGVKFFRGTIDDKWILLEYDPKTGKLTYDFDDLPLEGTKHTLKVIAIDNVNNTNVYIATFFRKNAP